MEKVKSSNTTSPDQHDYRVPPGGAADSAPRNQEFWDDASPKIMRPGPNLSSLA